MVTKFSMDKDDRWRNNMPTDAISEQYVEYGNRASVLYKPTEMLFSFLAENEKLPKILFSFTAATQKNKQTEFFGRRRK